MKRQIYLTRFFLIVILAVILIPASSLRAQNPIGNWQDTDNFDITWYTNAAPNATDYEINSAKQLAGLAKLVNEGTDNFAGKTIKLTATQPIDLSDRYWTPIGKGDPPFRGFLDGNNNTITGLRVDHSKIIAADVYSGLFGSIRSNKADFTAGVTNLTLEGGEVKGGGAVTSYTGALAGRVEAWGSGGAGGKIAITGITSTVAVSGGTDGNNSFTGGIIGTGEFHESGTVTLSGCINSGTVTGGKASSSSRTGGIIGYGYAGATGGTVVFTLSGCINTGTVTGGESNNSHTGGIIGIGSGDAGGMAGGATSVTLSDSYNTGDVIASKGYAGGIAGYIHTYAEGNTTATATILNCLSAGSVSNTDPVGGTTAATGGIVGALQQRNAGADILTVKNCLAIPASLTGEDAAYVHRIVGHYLENAVTLTNNYAHTSFGTWMPAATDNLNGADWTPPAVNSDWTTAEPFTAWTFNDPTVSKTFWMKENAGNYLPILNTIALELQEPRTLFRFTGEGTKEKPYLIRNRADLNFLSKEVNNGRHFEEQYLKLVPIDGQTLDMGTDPFTPIGNSPANSFRGFFDGNGKTIASLYINNSKNADGSVFSGLFGYIASIKDGFIAGVKDLTLEGTVTGEGAALSYTGALAGYVSVTGSGGIGCTIAITGITSTVAVSGSAADTDSFTGGLIGYGSGNDSGTFTLSGCINSGTVTGGKASRESYTGGIIGSGTGIGDQLGDGTFTLSGCINSGTVTGGKGDNSYTGGIIGNGLGNGIGNNGFVGIFILSDSYNTGDVIASRGHAGGIAGLMATSKAGNLNGNGTAIIRNCLSAGSVNNTDLATNGSASTGGIVGTLVQANDGADAPVVENCLAIPASLTGKDGVPLRRIAGKNDVTYPALNLKNNYAHTSFGSWEPAETNNLNGDDWEPPVAGTNWADNDPFAAWAFGAIGTPNTFWLDEPVGNCLPILNTVALALQQPRTLFRLNGNGTEEHPYIIRTRTDLDLLSEEVNNGNSFAGQYLKLEPTDGQTLDMGDDLFTPIGNDLGLFQGFFDGNGKTIAGLRVDNSKSTDNIVFSGLFGYIYSTKAGFIAGVKNLTLEGGEVKGGDTDYSYTGALAGRVIADNFSGAAGTIAITGITSTVAVSGGTGGTGSYTGGLIGEGYSNSNSTFTLSGCINTGTVTGGKVSDNSHTGGLVGYGVGNTTGAGSAAFTLSGCINTGTVTGGEAIGSYTGGLIGYGYGSCSNGTVGSFTLSDSYNTGDVIASKGYAGGIAGYVSTYRLEFDNGTATATIRNCLSAGSVNNTDDFAGGTAATGGIVGALEQESAGADPPVVENCLAIPASLTGKDAAYLHRIVGENKDNKGTLTNNYAHTSFGSWADKGTGKPNGADWEPPVAGNDWTTAEPFTAWAFSNPAETDKPWLKENAGNYLPILNTVAKKLQEPRTLFRFSGKGTEEEPYLIRTRVDLDFLSEKVNNGTTFAGQYFKLDPENGDMLEMGNAPFTPIGNSQTNSFQGFFDGNDKTIAGLYVDNSKNNDRYGFSGLFGHISSDKDDFTAGVTNLTLEGGEVKGGGTNTSYTGALAGLVSVHMSGGTAGTIAITGIASTVAVSGPAGGSLSYTGGIIGRGEGSGSGSATVTLSGCINSGTVTGGNTTGYSHTGGLIGIGSGIGSGTVTLSGCINTGTVTGGESNNSRTGGLLGSGIGIGTNGAVGSFTLSDSYNTGDVIASKGYVGGIAGYMETYRDDTATGTAIIRNCLSSGSVSNTDDSAGGTAATGGIVGVLRQLNGNPDPPVVENCLAIPISLTGKDGVPLRRIVGVNTVTDPTSNLKGNYAYVSSGIWTEKGHDKSDGADWNGLMTAPPVAGYDAAVWQTDATHKLMPKLTAIDASLQADVKNPIPPAIVTLTPGDHFRYTDNNGLEITVRDSLAIYGSSFGFRIEPAEGYTQSRPTVQAGTVVLTGRDGLYELYPVTQDSVITVSDIVLNRYEVTFESQDGSAVKPLSDVVHGTGIVEPGKPTKEGHTFGGWFIEPACTNQWQFDTYTVISDTTLYAKWTLNTYTVTPPAAGEQDGYTLTVIEPSDGVYTHGNKMVFRVDPDKAHNQSVPDVKLNGIPLAPDADGNYSFTIEGDAEITVGGIKLNTYTVTPPAAGEQKGYTLTVTEPAGGVYTHGDKVVFTVDLDEAHNQSVPEVKINGTPLIPDADGNYSFTVEGNTKITVGSVKPNRYTVTLPAIKGVTYDKQYAWQYAVTHGDDFTFRAVVAEGYSPISGIEASFGHEVTDNGDGTYTVKNVTRDIRVYIYGVTAVNKVTVTLTLDDVSLADCVQLFPGPGTYEVPQNEEMQILAYLADACDESDLVLIVNGETIIAEEKKSELRSTGYTFKVRIRGDTEIRVEGVKRNPTGLLDPSQGEVTVWTTPGHVVIEGRAENLRIYSLTGQLVDQRALAEGTTTIPLKKGVYMVAIDDEVVKVIVR